LTIQSTLNSRPPHQEQKHEKLERLLDTISCFSRTTWFACNPQNTRPPHWRGGTFTSASRTDAMFAFILNSVQHVHVRYNGTRQYTERDESHEYAVCPDCRAEVNRTLWLGN